MSKPPQSSSPNRGLGALGWATRQVGQFFGLLLTLVAFGLLRSIYRKEFHWRGFFSGLFVAVLGLAVTSGVVAALEGPMRGPKELTLWLGTLLAMFICGAVASRRARTVAVWEGYLVWLLVLGFLWVHLSVGWTSFIGLAADKPLSYFDTLNAGPPGAKLFGAMWSRMLGLWAAGGLVCQIIGSSLSFVAFGEEGKLDGGWRFEWTVARKHLAGRGGLVSVTALVAVLGVALGVAALVAVTAVMSGYEKDVQDKILSTNAHLVIQKYGVDFVEHDEIKKKALEIDGIVTGSPFAFNEAMLSDGDFGAGVLLKGVVPSEAGTVTSVEENLCDHPTVAQCKRYGPTAGNNLEAALADQDGVPSMVVGYELMRKLGKEVGAEVNLTTPVGLAESAGNAPRRLKFRIGGAFRSGMHEFDSRLIYLDLKDAQELMGLGKAVSGVEFRVSRPQEVEVLAKQAMVAIGRYPYRSLDWRDLNSGIFQALKLQKVAMFLVLCSIVIVAAFNIASTLFMAVVEKSREIGLLKSIGARNSSIMKIFMIEGWLVGFVGTMLGLVLGLLVCLILSQLELDIAAEVYMVDSLQVEFDPFEIVGTVLAALGISHLATVYPSLKAARQSPVDAMRYD